jgi:hypothetical protein
LTQFGVQQLCRKQPHAGDLPALHSRLMSFVEAACRYAF